MIAERKILEHSEIRTTVKELFRSETNVKELKLILFLAMES
jgi:hypothetical protein